MGAHGYGPIYEYIEGALAARLGLTEQHGEDALAAGKPMHQIALDNGIPQEDLANFLNEVHQDAFSRTVQDGVLTRDQADWMLQRIM